MKGSSKTLILLVFFSLQCMIVGNKCLGKSTILKLFSYNIMSRPIELDFLTDLAHELYKLVKELAKNKKD